MKITRLIFISFLLIFASSACSDDENKIERIPILDFSIKEVGYSWNPETIEEEKIYIINNADQLQSYLLNENELDISDIDFETNSLLLIRIYSTHGIGYEGSDLTMKDNGRYSLKIEIENYVSSVITNLYISILVPKLIPNAYIDLSITDK